MQIPDGAVARPLHELSLIYDFDAWIFKGSEPRALVKYDLFPGLEQSHMLFSTWFLR